MIDGAVADIGAGTSVDVATDAAKGSPVPAWLAWVRLAARIRVEEVRARWRERGEGDGAGLGAGVHQDVDHIVTGVVPACGGTADRLDALARAREAALADPAFGRLIAEFCLGRRDAELLALAAAAQADPRWGRVLAYLDDELHPAPVTTAAAATFWGWEPGTTVGPASALVTWRIAGPSGPEPWLPTAGWTTDADVVGYLFGADRWWTYWPGLALEESPRDCLHPETLAAMRAAVGALTQACEVELVGAPGTGRRTLLRQLARALGREALSIDDPTLGVRALRTARLLGAIPVWTAADQSSPIPVGDRLGAVTLVARETPDTSATAGVPRLSWTLPDLTASARLRLWSDMAGDQPVPAPVREWSLTPGEIRLAAAAAPAGAEAVHAATRRRLGAAADGLVRPLTCPFGWDDLVVSASVRDQLRELESQVRLRAEVLDGWEFRRLTPAGRGTTALFAGPSGTGKTMAAQILARSLGLELYRVDLAQTVDKYIGETEKRLARVFDDCERCHVVLFFDEADALFGQRTHVKDAHDRFANIEIDYLLQRMESFDGVALLATNRKGDLDRAFLRRLRVVVDFTAPTAEERLRLWELAIPAATSTGVPVGGDLDRRLLADELPLTGAEIKAVALAAAFLARRDRELIRMGHVLAAARRELAKRGAVLRSGDLTVPAEVSTVIGMVPDVGGPRPVATVRP